MPLGSVVTPGLVLVCGQKGFACLLVLFGDAVGGFHRTGSQLGLKRVKRTLALGIGQALPLAAESLLQSEEQGVQIDRVGADLAMHVGGNLVAQGVAALLSIGLQFSLARGRRVVSGHDCRFE